MEDTRRAHPTRRQVVCGSHDGVATSRLRPCGYAVVADAGRSRPNRLSKIECVLATWMSQNASRDRRHTCREEHTKPLRPETICQTFHHLIPQLGLAIPPGIDPPRLHCLRHSFAVQTLLHWYRTDVDPGRRLFHLATFMGHVSVESTAWYLTITDELLEEASRRFERFAARISQETPS